jgi:hypothetical protein
LPEDVQSVIAPVVDHRLQTVEHDRAASPGRALIDAVAVP